MPSPLRSAAATSGGISSHLHRRRSGEGAVAFTDQDGDATGIRALQTSAAIVGHGQVEPAIAVEIAGSDGEGLGADVIDSRRLEGAVAVAEQDRDTGGGEGGEERNGAVGAESKVELAIAVEIGGEEVAGRESGGIGSRGTEGTIAIAESDAFGGGEIGLPVAVEIGGGQEAAGGDFGAGRERIGAPAEPEGAIGGGDIGVAVSVEVGYGKRTDGGGMSGRGAGRWIVGRALESAVAVAVEDFEDLARGEVGDADIEVAVAIEIGEREVIGQAAGDVCAAGAEGAVAIAEADGEAVCAGVGDGEVEFAIAVEIGEGEVVRSAGTGIAGDGLMERAVAIPGEEDQGSGAGLIVQLAEGEIELAIAIEIRRDDGEAAGGGEAGGGAEGAVAVAEQEIERIGGSDGEVGLAVGVEVGDGKGVRIHPRGKFLAAWKVPSPLPSRMERLLDNWLVTAKSGTPSPLTSAMATLDGLMPTL